MSRGKVLGDRYKIGEKIGTGGFSTVYFCVDLQAAVDRYLEDRRREYEGYRLGFEMLRNEERGSRGGGSKRNALGNPVSFEDLCGSTPSPEEVIHPDVLQALLTTGRVPMLSSPTTAQEPAEAAATSARGGQFPQQPSDREKLTSPNLYRGGTPASSSLASSAAVSRRNNNRTPPLLRSPVTRDEGAIIHWGRTVVPPVFAVKVLNKAQLKQQNMEDAFEREVEAMKTITKSCPANVIKVIDVLQSTRNYYLVMDLADQGSLLAVIVRNNATLTGGGGGGLPAPAARKYFRQLINGLSFVHGADVVHRDIKPENLLLDRWRDVRLSDFGFAAYSPPGRMLTRPCGTPQYAAPEVLVDKPRYDGRKVDMWSTGITLFVIAFGCLPFYANTLDKLYAKILRGVYEIPKTLRKPPPPSLIHLLSVLLDVNPKTRWSVEMVRVHPWVLGRDDIPERLQHSYLLSMKRKYRAEKRGAPAAAAGRLLQTLSPVEDSNGTQSAPSATKSFLALTAMAGLDPKTVQTHLHHQPLLGRSVGDGSDASSDQQEKDMEALIMGLENDLDDDEFTEGTDGYLYVQQHRKNVATVTQASSSCPNLRQIQGGFVVDGGRSKEGGNNHLHRAGVSPPEQPRPEGSSSAFFNSESPAMTAQDATTTTHYSNSPLPLDGIVMGASVNGCLGKARDVTEKQHVTRGNHILDMVESSLSEGSIAVDVETGLLVLMDGLDASRRTRLAKATQRVQQEHPEVDVTRYATVLQPLLEELDHSIAQGESADVPLWGASLSGGAASTTSPPLDPAVYKRNIPNPKTTSQRGHSRTNSIQIATSNLMDSAKSTKSGTADENVTAASKSSTPSSRPQSTPSGRLRDRSTPEEINKREKHAAFRRLGLVHIQIILNFLAVFAIIFVAGTAKVLFDVDVAKWPMPSFLRRFIDRILSPPKQSPPSSTGSAGYSTSRSTPGFSSPSTVDSHTPGSSLSRATPPHFSTKSPLQNRRQSQAMGSSLHTANSSISDRSVMGASMKTASNKVRTPHNKSSSDIPNTLPPSTNQAPATFPKAPSTFTLASTPLTTASSTHPLGHSPGMLPQTSSPSGGISFPAADPPATLGGSPPGIANLLRPKPTRKVSNLSSASSDDNAVLRSLTAQPDIVAADPVPEGASRLLQPRAVSPLTSEERSPNTNSFTLQNSSFHSQETVGPVCPKVSVTTATSASATDRKGGLKKTTSDKSEPHSPLLRKVKLSTSAYKRSGVLDEDYPDKLIIQGNAALADEDANNHAQQGFKPTEQAKLGLQKMKRIDSHHGGAGALDLADMDDDETSLAT